MINRATLWRMVLGALIVAAFVALIALAFAGMDLECWLRGSGWCS